jgi:hypothetical protein
LNGALTFLDSTAVGSVSTRLLTAPAAAAVEVATVEAAVAAATVEVVAVATVVDKEVRYVLRFPSTH